MAFRPAHQMTDAELLAEAEEIRRADDREALANPVRLARHLDYGYKRRRHLNVIGEAMADVAAGTTDRLMILTPPQVGKTVTAVVWGSFWWLCRNPAHRVIVGSYGNILAVNRGRSVRRLVVQHGHRYDLALEAGSRQVANWSLTTGGGMQSVGIGAGVTGNPGDFAILDDVHKSRAEADSLKRRDAISEWLSADLISRLSPGAPIILIMTAWHPDDIRGRLLSDEGRVEDGGRWRVLHMPALCTHPGTDPLGRAAGEPLPHPKIPPGDTGRLLTHWRDKRRSTRTRDWSAQYLGDPQPAEGALLSEAQLRAQRWYGARVPIAKPKIHAVAVDPSGGGRDTCGIIAGWLGTDDRLYLTHDWTDVLAVEDWGRRVCVLAMETDADRIIVEANYGGDQALAVVRNSWDALRRAELTALGLPDTPAGRRDPDYLATARYDRLPPRIVAVHSRKRKLLRAEPVAVQWTTDRIRTVAHMPELEQEWATWQPDASDSPGRIDASVHLAWGLLRPPTVGAEGATAAGVSREQVQARGGPGGVAGTAARVSRTRHIPPAGLPRGYPGAQ